MATQVTPKLVNHWRKVLDAQAAVSNLWKLMCEEEGVPTDSKFVVFTSTNKYSAEYNKAVNVFFTLRKAVR